MVTHGSLITDGGNGKSIYMDDSMLPSTIGGTFNVGSSSEGSPPEERYSPSPIYDENLLSDLLSELQELNSQRKQSVTSFSPRWSSGPEEITIGGEIYDMAGRRQLFISLFSIFNNLAETYYRTKLGAVSTMLGFLNSMIQKGKV